MANTNLKDSVYEAIDVIVQKRIEDSHLDKTVVCNIVAYINAAKHKYKVSYMGGEMIAYTKDKEIYPIGTEVYVIIPQGDFSNKKWIIGSTENNLNETYYIKANNLLTTLADDATNNEIITKINNIIDRINSITYLE